MTCNCGFTAGDIDYFIYSFLHLERKAPYSCLCSFCWNTFENQFQNKMKMVRTLSSCKSSPPDDLVGEVPLHPMIHTPVDSSNQAA